MLKQWCFNVRPASQTWTNINPLTAKLFNMNSPTWKLCLAIPPLSEWKLYRFDKILLIDILSLACLKGGTYCANKKWKPEYMRHRRLKHHHFNMSFLLGWRRVKIWSYIRKFVALEIYIPGKRAYIHISHSPLFRVKQISLVWRSNVF